MCIFCAIASGEIPSKKVYENDKYLAFLDLSQVTYGHTLVVPKKHYDNALEMGNEEFGDYLRTVQKVANKLNESLKPEGMNILNNVKEAAGQSVMHVHFHLIPRYGKDDALNIEFGSNSYDLDEIVSKIG